MARVDFGCGIVHELYYARDPFSPVYRRALPSESFIEKPWKVSEPPTALEALKESPEWTIKTQTVRYVNITSNWISEISVFNQHNSLMEFSTSIASFWVTIFLLLHLTFFIDFIDFIFLCFYQHLYNYCNRVLSDQSSNVACRCLYRGCCYFNMYTVKEINWPEMLTTILR